MAPDGTKLSKRRHGPVVSVTTYRDAGFLPHAFVNFLCLLGWSPKDDREQMTAPGTDGRLLARRHQPHQRGGELHGRRSVRSQGGVAERRDIRAMPVERTLPARCCRWSQAAGFAIDAPRRWRRSRRWSASASSLLRDVLTVADFFFVRQLPPYDPAELIPKKGDAALALRVLEGALRGAGRGRIHPRRRSKRALRAAAGNWGSRPARCSSPSAWRCAAARTAPPLFGNTGSAGPRDLPRAHRARPSES